MIPSVLVYAIGKVGSTSLRAGLETCFEPGEVVQTHALGAAERRRLMELRDIHSQAQGSWVAPCEELWQALHNGSNPALKVITVVRDPVAREISHMFHMVWGQLSFLERKDLTAKLFREKVYFLPYMDVDSLCTWYEREFDVGLGVRTLHSEFDKERGWSIVRSASRLSNRVDVLYLTTERLSEVWPEAIAEFLGLGQEIALSRSLSSSKGLYREYEKFVRKIRFPADILRPVYASPAVKHFYTDRQISSFMEKWAE
jgi:hypothetical protein